MVSALVIVVWKLANRRRSNNLKKWMPK